MQDLRRVLREVLVQLKNKVTHLFSALFFHLSFFLGLQILISFTAQHQLQHSRVWKYFQLAV